MPTSTSRLSYEDCFKYYEAALVDPKGIRILFTTKGDARQFLVRMNTARKLDREENADIYQQGHPLFGRSEYDQVMVRLVAETGQEETWIYIERRGGAILQVQNLSELDSLEVEYTEQKTIAQSPLKQLTFGEIERRD